MESRPGNLGFILRKAHGASYLQEVIIHKTPQTIARAVSDMDLLSVAIAVDDEIAREESTGKVTDNLLELYRIRYECVARISKYLIENLGIAGNDYGMALRAYVFAHIDGCESEMKFLEFTGIYPVSLPDAAHDFIKKMPNKLYGTLLHYAQSYFRSEAARQDSMTSSLGQSVNLGDSVPGFMEFTVFGDEPVAREQAESHFEMPVRAEMQVNKLGDVFFNPVGLDVVAMGIIDDQNKDVMLKFMGVFDAPGMFMSKDNLQKKQELERKVRGGEFRGVPMGVIKDLVKNLKLHLDMERYESEMNASLENDDEKMSDFRSKWRKLSRYARTAHEFLPNFLEKLDAIDLLIDATLQAVVADPNLWTRDKAKKIIDLNQAREAVKRERELVCESMLARLECLGDKALFGIMNGDNKQPAFYVNLVHEAYQKFYRLHDKDGRERNIEEGVKQPDLRVDDISKFMDLIKAHGTDEQQQRLNQLVTDQVVQVAAWHHPELIESYLNTSSIPPEVNIEFHGEAINVEDMVAANYIGVEQMQKDPGKMEKFSELCRKYSKDSGAEFDEAVLAGQLKVFHIVEIAAVNSPYAAYDAFYRANDDFADEDKFFFAYIFTEKFFPHLIDDGLFLQALALLPDTFDSRDGFNEFYNTYMTCRANNEVNELLKRLALNKLDGEGLNVLFTFMNIFQQKQAGAGEGGEQRNYGLDQVATVDGLNKWNKQHSREFDFGESEFSSEFSFEPGLDSFLVREPMANDDERDQTKKSWWKAALIGVGTGLLVGGAIALGIGLGVITAPVTVTALVLAAVVAVPTLIGFGIGTIVGKVRDAKRQKQAAYMPVHTQDSAGNQSQNFDHTPLSQSAPDSPLQSSGKLPLFMHGSVNVNQRKDKEDVSPDSSPRPDRK